MSTAAPVPKIACPHCHGQIKVPALQPGSLVTCPKCGQAFKLAGRSEEAVRPQGAEARPHPAAPTQARPAPAKEAPRKEAPAPSEPRAPAASAPPLPRAHSGTRGAVVPPPAPAPVVAGDPGPASVLASSEGLVPIEHLPAANATQPAHQPSKPRSETVDPLVLGPQPAPKPPPAKEVAVVCYLCNTRMYAPLSKVGETIQCPDCHTVNEVKPPKAPPAKKQTGPTLDDAPDYGLNHPGDRPAYRPIVAPRGEYAALAEFDPAQRPPGWGNSDVQMTSTAAPQGQQTDDDEPELTIAAPVERIEIKPEIKPLPPPDPEDSLYDGKYDDGLIGDGVDASQPGAWKKAPLLIGILGFLFYTSTLPRLLLYPLGLAVGVNIIWGAIQNGSSDDPSHQVLAIFLSIMATTSMGIWVVSFAAVLLAIVQDTANGLDEVISWPDWNMFDWIATAIYFPAAALLAVLPGAFLTTALVSIGLDTDIARFAAAMPLVISFVVLFPLVLYSMLAEGTIAAPYSQHTYRSLAVARDGWVYFYMYSVLIGFLGSMAAGFVSSSNAVLNSGGAIALVVLAMVYCRILGRLMWYASEQLLKEERLEAARAEGARA